MAVATGELYQFTQSYFCKGQTMENVWMLRERTGLSTAGDMRAEGQAIWNLYRQLMSSQVTINELRLKRMTPVAFDQDIFTAAEGQLTGTQGGEPVNTTVALVTTFRTGVAGKRHRGRCYTGGFPANGTTAGQNLVDAGFVDDVQGFWDDIFELLGDADGTSEVFALGIYSGVIGGYTPVTVAGWQAVSQIVPHRILGNQRRRRTGVGI